MAVAFNLPPLMRGLSAELTGGETKLNPSIISEKDY